MNVLGKTWTQARRSPFQGLAAVTIDDEYTYIDKTGQVITERRFLRAMNFSDGLAAVNIDGKYGYINKDGHIVIKCQYYYYDFNKVP